MNLIKSRVLNIVTLLFLFSLVGTIVSFVSSSLIIVNAQTSTVPNNPLQYEWLGVNRDVAQTHFAAGTAPSSPTIKWQKSVPGVGSDPLLFNGMLFITQGQNIVAMNPETGTTIYTIVVPKVLADRTCSASAILKIDNTYMVAMSSTGSIVNSTHSIPAAWALRAFKISDGSLIWSMPPQYGPTIAYRPRYVEDTKMIYTVVGNSTGRGGTQNPGGVQAWSLSDPTQQPTLAWTWINFGVTYGVGSFVYGDGRLFVGGSEPHQTCLDARTGAVLWETQLTGSVQYGGSYYNGVLYRGLLDNTFVALEGSTGKILWANNPSPFGFWASATAAGYGLVYETNVDGYFYAFNATTGDIVWKYLGPGQYYPGFTEVADGKVYTCTGQGVPSPITGQGVSEFTCFNASTGKVIWQVNREFRSGPSDYMAIAYGNFYAVDQITENGVSTFNSPAPKVLDTILYCYGGSETPKDWSMYGSDPAHTAIGNGGPTSMSQEWVFATGGAVMSSPAVAQGKLYIGSDDHNWYCIDAITGAKIWNFTTGYYVRASPAVVNGKVYTGTEDGFAYCLDANTGSVLWKTAAPGVVLPIMTGTYPEWRSSPVVTAGKVYVGSLDGKLYCFDANSGSVSWALQASNAILSNPTYIEGDGIYFGSVDGVVYKVNPASGSVIWNVTTPIGLEFAMEGSACVGNGMVVIGSGAAKNAPAQRGQMYCFNATTGARIWTYNQKSYNTTVPNMQPTWTALYLKHEILGPVFYFSDFYHFTCVNATNGVQIWSTYLTREHFGLPAYAANKIYIPSDTFGIYVCDATTGAKIEYFDAGGQVRSSPAIYDSKVYFGSNSWNVYCVSQSSKGTTYYSPTPSPEPTPTPTATPEATLTPSPTQTLTPQPTATPTQASTATPVATATPTQTAAPQPEAGIPTETILIITAAIIIVAVIAAAAFVLRKRK
jgi:eukaryotic-like serine/threonine-protein kinase